MDWGRERTEDVAFGLSGEGRKPDKERAGVLGVGDVCPSALSGELGSRGDSTDGKWAVCGVGARSR